MADKIPTYGIYNTPEVYDMITAPGTGWNWVNSSELNSNDPLYQSAVSQGLDRYLVNQNKELVPFSAVRQFVDNHNYQRQLPYQEQNDINDAALMNIRAGDRNVRNRSMTQANKTEMNNLANLGLIIGGTGIGAGVAAPMMMAAPLVGSATFLGGMGAGLYGASKGSELYNKHAWPIYNRMAQTIFPSMPSYNTFEDAVEGVTNGYIRRDNAGFGNPGGVIVGILGGGMGAKGSGATADMAKYTAGRGTWYAPIEYTIAHTPQGKRLIEQVMRQSASADPIPGLISNIDELLFGGQGKFQFSFSPKAIAENLKNLKIHKEVPEKLNYVLFGKKGKTGYHNTLNPSERQLLYRGLLDGDTNKDAFVPTDGYGDVIDAYLYGTELDPRIGRRLDPTFNDYGIHNDYVHDFYPNRNIPIYELSVNTTKPTISSEIPLNKYDITSKDYGIPLIDNHTYDAAGHRAYSGRLGNKEYMAHQDIWKFNPKDYALKWFKEDVAPTNPNLNLSKDEIYNMWRKSHKLQDMGLNTVNEAGNPVVARTPWIEKIVDIFSWGDDSF